MAAKLPEWDALIEDFNAEASGSNEAARCKQGEVVMVARDTVQPYKELRQNLARRDRSLREKVVTLEEAASFVNDGASSALAARPCHARRWP